jgi:FkbM family methyltransferase
LDAGASAGFFSAIFNRTTDGVGQILSVEPDTNSFRLLQETIRLNGSNPNWRAVNCALSGEVGELTFLSSGFGGDLGGADSTRESMFRGKDKEPWKPNPQIVRVETLESLCAEIGFVPDLVKMDIESYEFEALGAALKFLGTHRPKLFLEIHNEKIRGRGLDPEQLLRSLIGIGYHCHDGDRLGALCAQQIIHLCLAFPVAKSN